MESLTLKFSAAWQNAIVGYMFADYPFLLRCKQFIPCNYFEDPISASIVKEIYALTDRMPEPRRVPSFDEIHQQFIRKHPDKPTQDKFRAEIQLRIASCKNVNFGLIQKDLTMWIKIIKKKDAIEEMMQLFNQARFDDIEAAMRKWDIEIGKANFDKDDAFDFTDLSRVITRKTSELEHCLTTGSVLLDKLLVDGGDKLGGGLVRGDATVLMGPVNSGKTSTLITMIAANVLRQRHVLYITHEQKEDDIVFNMLKCMHGWTADDLSRHALDCSIAGLSKVERDTALKISSAMLNNHLTYIPYVKTGEMYVENVVNLIQIRQQECIAKNQKGFDLLVVDYPGKLQAKAFGGRKADQYSEQMYIYDQFVNLALQHKFHAILPVQTNREGYKVSQGGADRMLNMGDVASSFGIMHIASNVITINRSQEDQKSNIMSFYVAKSRSSETGRALITHTDFPRATVFGPKLKGQIADASNNTLVASMKRQFITAAHQFDAQVQAQASLVPPAVPDAITVIPTTPTTPGT